MMGLDDDSIAKELEKDLLTQYGPLLHGESLRSALGFRSMESMRQAIARGVIEIPIFELKGRRGRYALTKDVVRWLIDHRQKAFRKP